MVNATYTMLDGAAIAETAGNTIISVWYNAIYEVRDPETDQYTMQNGRFVKDFDDALASLYNDDDFSESTWQIFDNQNQVYALIKKLKNPPKEYEDYYPVLQAYYESYLQLTSLVSNPAGHSLDSFSADFRKLIADTVRSFKKMELYLE